jgi:hypothetical protein
LSSYRRSGTSVATSRLIVVQATIFSMARQRVRPGFTLVLTLLFAGFCFTLGCARSSTLHRNDLASDSTVATQNLPFHPNPDQATDESVHPAVPDAKPVSSTPFPAASRFRTIPAGTLITVRLQNSLSISKARAGDVFVASVAEPLTADGGTLIEAGTPVSGTVESAQASENGPGTTPDPGYLRLALNAITVDGRTIGLQTSSLFAKGSFQSNAPQEVSSGGNGMATQFKVFQIQKGHRLTFRLTTAVKFPEANSLAKR